MHVVVEVGYFNSKKVRLIPSTESDRRGELRNFNSKKVRLILLLISLYAALMVHFNSKKVRLIHATNFASARDELFQFQKGSINTIVHLLYVAHYIRALRTSAMLAIPSCISG